MKEIEIRYRLSGGQRARLLAALAAKGWIAAEIMQRDTYFCAKEYSDTGRTSACPYVVRIRQMGAQSSLTYKSFQGGDGSSWLELETRVEDPEVLGSILGHLQLTAYMIIAKRRLSGRVEGIEVNIDAIDVLGDFVELEVLTEDEQTGRRQLMELAELLGLPGDGMVTKGYIQLMEQVLA